MDVLRILVQALVEEVRLLRAGQVHFVAVAGVVEGEGRFRDDMDLDARHAFGNAYAVGEGSALRGHRVGHQGDAAQGAAHVRNHGPGRAGGR